METTPALTAFSSKIERVEATAGQNVLDEADFSKNLAKSFDNFVDHVSKNSFLESGEKEQLLSRVDARVSGILYETMDRFDGSLRDVNQKELQGLTLTADLLSRDADTMINNLLSGVERQLRTKQTGFEGISDAEFHEIMLSLAATRPFLPRYTLSSTNTIEEAFARLEVSTEVDLLLSCPLGQETVYLKATTANTVLLFLTSDPRVCLSLATTPLPTQIDLIEKISLARDEMQARALSEKTEADNLNQALSGHPEALRQIDTDWSSLPQTQAMAIESAYNMGLEAARSVKMQLLLFKVAQRQEYILPSGFALDGSWGPRSNLALEIILRKENLPYIENDSTQNLKTLMTLHRQLFPKDNTEIFLTADEINDPRYKFENKGVYRGLKVRAVKARLLENGFDINQMAQEKVFGNEITPKVMAAFPRALAVLQKLTSDKDLQASILGTMIMESGLSGSADSIGLGRGDRKDYARYVSENMPRIAAAFNEYSPMRLDANSSGIMQINYKTAQGLIQNRLGQYYPKDMLIAKLEESVELSTVVAFLVYQNNQDSLQKTELLYSTPTMSV